MALTIEGLGASQTSTELKLGADAVFPGQDLDWDKGYGASAQWIFWHDALGFGFSIGAQKWDVNDTIYSYGQYLGSGIALGYAAGLEGDATMIPLGGSALYKIPISKSLNLTIDGGIRYVLVNSNVKVVEAAVLGDAYGNSYIESASYDVDIGNGLVGIIGANLEYELNKGFKIFAKAGYQFDLIEGKTEVVGSNIEYDNELKGAFVGGGLAWEWPTSRF